MSNTKVIGHTSAKGIVCYEQKRKGIRYVSICFDISPKKNTIGCQEGELICNAFDYAAKKKLPVVAFVSSGGIRVTEGTKALMQMAKMAVAIKEHSNQGLLFIAVVYNLTLGGVSASLVSLADIIIGKKMSIYGFSGKRIVESTTREIFPDNFQTVEYAKEHGMIDIVANEDEIMCILYDLLRMHTRDRKIWKRYTMND